MTAAVRHAAGRGTGFTPCGLPLDSVTIYSGVNCAACLAVLNGGPAHRMPQATDTTWSPQVLTGADARALRADDAARESRELAALRSARFTADDYQTLTTVHERVARLEVVRAAIHRAEAPARRRRRLQWALTAASLALGIAGLYLTAQIPGLG